MPEQQPPVPDPNHYLVSANGRLGNPPRSAVTDVARILDHAIRQAPENGLVIHFHGGLVPRDDALNDITAPLTRRYAQAKAYPLFFVWESGFKEAFLNNKRDLPKDPAFRELVKKTSEWVLKKVPYLGGIHFRGAGGRIIEDEDAFRTEYDHWFDGERDAPPVSEDEITSTDGMGLRAAAGEPDLDDLAYEIEVQLDDDPGFKEALAATFSATIPPETGAATRGAGAAAEPAAVVNLSAEALDEMFPPADGAAPSGDKLKTRGVLSWAKVAYFVARIVIDVIRRIRSSRDHGVYCTIIEEVLRRAFGGDLIGATVWNAMKKDTQDSFGPGTDTCGLLVVQKLKALEDEGKRFRKITLVGHSTGAIYICHFLDSARSLGLATPIEVVFLAPAITCERFAQALDAHETTSLNNFRMFAMRDSRETADAMLKPLYTRSLLYFVSGLLEGVEVDGRWQGTVDMPLVGMERFFTATAFANDAHARRVRAFLEAAPNRMVWSTAAGAGRGLNSDAGRHGDFDNDEPTLASLVEIIQGSP